MLFLLPRNGQAEELKEMTGLVLVCFGQDSGLLTFKEDRMGSSLSVLGHQKTFPEQPPWVCLLASEQGLFQ